VPWCPVLNTGVQRRTALLGSGGVFMETSGASRAHALGAHGHQTVNGRGGRPTAGVRDRLDGMRDAAPDRAKNQGESEGQKDGVGWPSRNVLSVGETE
jgi:hypothetical protein